MGWKPLQNTVGLFSYTKKKKKRRSSEGSRKPLLGTGSTWRAWLCAGPRARPRITGSVGASYLYFTGEMACVAEVATASTMVSQNARSQPKLRQHWESKLLSSPMGLIHRMTPPTEHRHFVKGGFPASQYAPPSPSPVLNLNVRDQGKGLAKRRRDHCPIR